jgi:YhcH/YjgK/YiaL family protein
MIFGETNNPALAGIDLSHPVWKRCWEWLENWKSEQPLGIDKLKGDLLFANLHGYDTKEIPDCKWEAHKVTIDLQVVLKGGELIDFLPESELVQKEDYDAEKERWLYEPAESASRIHLTAGRFAVFWPGEPHRPQIKDNSNSGVIKVVFKINQDLFAECERGS